MNTEELIKIIKECGDIILKYRNSNYLEINSNFGAWGTWDVCSGHAILSQLGGAMTDYSKESLKNGFISADSIEKVKQLHWIKNLYSKTLHQ